MRIKKLKNLFIVAFLLLVCNGYMNGRQIIFDRDFSPAEGLITPQEHPYRQEICLNGLWDFQQIPVPGDWKSGTGEAPVLAGPFADKWDPVKIKIPSPVNVNNWGGGFKTGEGTNNPYAPGSIYYPSYPENWVHTRMGWLRRTFTLPEKWTGKRLILHFEGVAGECKVYVNGKEAGCNFDAFLPFEADITDFVDYGRENELLIGVRHSKLFDLSHPEYTKFGATYPPGSNMDNLIGIWNDVFLWALPDVRITDVFVQPYLDKGILDVEVEITNQSEKKQKLCLDGDIREWINLAGTSVREAPEIKWKLGNSVAEIKPEEVSLAPGETKKIILSRKITNELKTWSPDQPDLYTLVLKIGDKKTTFDCKTTRFGWRQFRIAGNGFELNGKPIQCFGDIQHPFGPYICSRRFAFAWYQMIKDFGGNCVRPHAQPWPRVYYDLADEMGLMVLDETALFGSSIRLNFEEELTWQRSQEHLDRLILRDRNHPSVIGWSAGNELFAIALLNKPSKEVSDKWDDRMTELALSTTRLDPTRDFITLDGDRDMGGRLPVWSKHFSHGLQLNDLPQHLDKPLVVGESGATYYGRPIQLYPFAGEKAFECYEGRSEALAIDIYQNVVQMAKPFLAYYSPSEVCWFGIEHLNLGYNDFTRLPDLSDGIFAGKPYEEGKPGYQFERIPPYVTTFNPGLDPDLPLYKPLPMFLALKAALASPEPEPCPWDNYVEKKLPAMDRFPEPVYGKAMLIAASGSPLEDHLKRSGIVITSSEKEAELLFIDAEKVNSADLKKAEKLIRQLEKKGGIIMAMGTGKPFSADFTAWLPENLQQTERYATALENNPENEWGQCFQLPHLYFAEMQGDRKIQKSGLKGKLVENGSVVFSASRTDWSLFNNQPENRKCAQIVLYESLRKPEGTALVTYPLENAKLNVSVLDYTLDTKETREFWHNLYSVMRIALQDKDQSPTGEKGKAEHDLLMDGPVD